MSFKVYEAICNITNDLAKVGISKGRKNQQQGYNFRGIDDVYFALSPLLSKYKLCILPRVISRDVVERQTQKGGTLFYTTIEMEFDFVSAEDGSKHTVRMIGEAMDSGDKSSNKAQSSAYKYAAFQTFCIPTEEASKDVEEETHVVKAKLGANAFNKALEAVRKGEYTAKEISSRYDLTDDQEIALCDASDEAKK